MSRLCCCMLVLSWLVVQDQLLAKPSLGRGLRHVVKRELVAVATSVLLSGGVVAASDLPRDFHADYVLPAGVDERALTDEEIELAWRRVRNNPPQHYLSVFYLLLDGFKFGKRVTHIQFIGYSEDDEPLFVGARNHLLSADKKNGEPQFIWRWVQASLVGHHGLIAQNVEVKEVTHFSHPAHEAYDQTLLVIKGVNLSEYEPLRIAPHPEPDTPLTMLSYRIRQKNLLEIFAYPLERRACSTDFFATEDLMLVHDCHIPISPSVHAAPIFNAQTHALVALYFGVRPDGSPYAAVLLPELLDYMTKRLDVSAQRKMTTTWGAVKRGSPFKKASQH